jgi:hypothetical protein
VNKALKQVLVEVAVALGGTALTVALGFLTRVVFDPKTLDKLKAAPEQLKDLLAVQFDIAIIAATLLVGTAFSLGEQHRGRLFAPFVVVVGGGMLLLVLAASAYIFDTFHPDLLKFVIPDLLSLCLVIISIHAAVNARTE